MRLLTLCLTLLSSPFWAQAVAPGDQLRDPSELREFTKNVERSFAVNTSGTLTLDHRYGDIEHHIWAKPEVRIAITITVQASDEKRAEATFKKIDFEFAGTREAVLARTLLAINEKSWSNGWGSWENSNANEGIEIDYDVWAPAGFALNITQRYGDVLLPSMSSATSINLSYGDLVAANLDGTNKLEINYGEANYAQARSLDARVRYGKLSVVAATLLAIDSRYSEAKLGRIGTLDISGGYDDVSVQSVRVCNNKSNYSDLKVDSAVSLMMDGDYSDLRLGYLAETGKFKFSYGDVSIGSISTRLKSVAFAGQYADFHGTMSKSMDFSFDAKAQYGDVTMPTGVQLQVHDESGHTVHMRGQHGGQPIAQFTLTTSYGDLVLR